MSYVLDTNSLIYFFRDQGRIAENLYQRAPTEIILCAPVLYELEVGLAKSNAPQKRRQQLFDLMKIITYRDFGQVEARSAASLREKLERIGQPIGPLDNLIAGCAMAYGDVLVTRNIREFVRIPGLQIENWY